MASSSQSSTFGTDNLKSLSLFKFSYVTSPSLQGKLLWTHLPERDHLFAVFDHLNSRNSSGLLVKRKFLKIIRGGDVLAQVNLEDLVYQARLDEDKATSQPLTDHNRLTILIVKKPLIALRYQLPDKQIQRMQMNFAPESGYDVALDCFSSLGLPIRDKNIQHEVQQPVQPGKSSQNAVSSTSYTRSPDMGSQEISYRYIHDAQENTQSHSFIRDIRPTTTSTDASDRTVEGFTPSSLARNYSSQPNLPSSSTSNLADPFLKGLDIPHLGRPCRQQSPPRSNTSNGRLESSTDLVSEWKMSTTDNPEEQSRGSVDTTRRAFFQQEILEAQRPTIVPRSMTLEAFSQILPPKRILPFPDPPTKPSRSDLNSKAIRSSSAILPRSETPAAKKRKTPIRKTLTKAKPHPAEASSRVTVTTLKPSEPAKSSVNTNLSAARNTRSKTTGVLAENENCAKAPVPLTDSTPDKINLQQDGLTTRGSNEEQTDRADASFQKHSDSQVPRDQSISPISDLAEYAKLPEKERLAALDTLILEYVQDENFATLCEDVEKSWRRIGLGF